MRTPGKVLEDVLADFGVDVDAEAINHLLVWGAILTGDLIGLAVLWQLVAGNVQLVLGTF